jgi:hypothetical protein
MSETWGKKKSKQNKQTNKKPKPTNLKAIWQNYQIDLVRHKIQQLE